MNAAELKKIATIKKKLNCDLVDCTDKLAFEVLDTELEHLEREKVKYRGRCTKCKMLIVVNRKQIDLIEKAFGKVHIVVRKLNFDSLFNIDK